MRVIKAAVLLLAALPMAGIGNQTVGLAPGQQLLAAVRSTVPATQPVAASASSVHAQTAADEVPRDTRRVAETITALTEDPAALDADAIDELETQLDEEITDVEDELDELEQDLEDRDDELDLLRDTNELRAAQAKLGKLEDQLAGLTDQVRSIRRADVLGGDPAPLIEQVRKLGIGIEKLHVGIRELDDLINIADEFEEDPEENKQKISSSDQPN